MRASDLCFTALVVLVQVPAALAQPRITLFGNPIEANGTAGPTDFSACQIAVTYLFDGMMAKFAFSIYASTAWLAWDGIGGAEFYVQGLEGLPSGWTTTVSYAPEVVVTGHPTLPHLQDGQTIRRVDVAWPVDRPDSPNCQKDALAFLARVECFSVGSPEAIPPTLLAVVAGDPASCCPDVACPLLWQCDAPTYTMECVLGSSFILNPPIEGHVGAPDPPEGAAEVVRDVVLGWEFFPGLTCALDGYDAVIKFGTNPGQLQTFYDPPCCPPGCSGSTQEVRLCWSPGLLQPYTTYYWQAGRSGGYSFLGPVWQFTTGATVATTHVPWSLVKQLYR